LLSTPRLIGDPAEKRALGRHHQAVAVEMESAAAAQYCANQGIPFGSIRVISDCVTTALSPQLLRLLDGGSVSLRSLPGLLLRSPGLVVDLWRLARDTHRASGLLACAVDVVLRHQAAGSPLS